MGPALGDFNALDALQEEHLLLHDENISVNLGEVTHPPYLTTPPTNASSSNNPPMSSAARLHPPLNITLKYL